MNTTRTLAGTTCATVVLCALAACGGGSGSADDANTVRVVGYVGPFEDVFVSTIAEPYMAEHDDVEIEFVESKGSAEDLATLRSENGNPSSDVVILDTSFGNIANNEGLFAPLDKQIVTNVSDIDQAGQSADGFGPAFTYDSLVILYNTENVSTPPTSWNGLADPEYEGSLLVNESMGIFFGLTLNSLEGADYKETFAPAIHRLEELAPSVQTWAAQPDPYTLVANGTADIGLGYNARAQLYVDQTDGAIGVSEPEEGSVLQTNTINLVAGSENATAAQKFINYALSPEAQQAFASELYYAPTNTKAVLDPKVHERTALGMLGPEQIIPVDWLFVTGKVEEWTERIHREAVGG